MSDKIEWYKEVLEIEPSSKVFFPLARLLSENDRKAEAVSVLRQGLERHPEFFEARLMLIDLLHDDTDGAQQSACEVSTVSGQLCAYPGFWDAWARHVEQTGGNRSLAFTLRFLAAYLKDRNLSLLDIFERGMNAACAKHPEAAPMPVEAKEKEAPESEPVPSKTPVSAGIEALERMSREKDARFASESFDVSADAEDGALQEEPACGKDASDFEEGAAERFSLRTRTMAALLADQGDFQGALDIYNELLAAAQNDEQRSELEMCIRNVRARMKSSVSMPEPVAEPAEEPLKSKQNLVKTLERLAQRLESRAVH